MAPPLTHEDLITFPQLAKRLPRRRRGRPVAVSTVGRWRYPGVKGVRLEAVRLGGAWVTSVQAFDRFVARTTAAASGDTCSAERITSGKAKSITAALTAEGFD